MSAQAIVASSPSIVGVGRALPEFIDSPRVAAGLQTIESGLAQMFSRLGLPMPTRVGETVTKSFKSACYTRYEVYELLWQNIALYIDARIVAMLPKHRALKADFGVNHRPSQRRREASWPASDAEWLTASKFISDALPHARDELTPITIDAVVEHIFESAMYGLAQGAVCFRVFFCLLRAVT